MNNDIIQNAINEYKQAWNLEPETYFNRTGREKKLNQVQQKVRTAKWANIITDAEFDAIQEGFREVRLGTMRRDAQLMSAYLN